MKRSLAVIIALSSLVSQAQQKTATIPTAIAPVQASVPLTELEVTRIENENLRLQNLQLQFQNAQNALANLQTQYDQLQKNYSGDLDKIKADHKVPSNYAISQDGKNLVPQAK
jgi:peptidoglycan hydrolase CwlO-like protein